MSRRQPACRDFLSPNLNLTTTSNNANPHRREEVMCRIGVLINTAVKHCSGVFPDSRTNQRFPAGMFLDEIRHVMDHTGDDNKGFASLRAGNETVPGTNR